MAKRDNKETDCSNERNRDIYYSTQLGSATVASSLTPHEALIVFKEFNKARHSLVLENELHMIYLVRDMRRRVGGEKRKRVRVGGEGGEKSTDRERGRGGRVVGEREKRRERERTHFSLSLGYSSEYSQPMALH